MNWNAVGAIGQILGSLATFVTVVYLAVQLHDSELETQRAIAQSRQERNMELNLALATNERLAAIHVKGNAALMRGQPLSRDADEFDPPANVAEELKSVNPFLVASITQLGLTAQETVMLSAELNARWNSNYQTILYVDKLLSADREQFERTFRDGFSEPLIRFWWEFNKPSYNLDAVRYVDNLLAQPG